MSNANTPEAETQTYLVTWRGSRLPPIEFRQGDQSLRITSAIQGQIAAVPSGEYVGADQGQSLPGAREVATYRRANEIRGGVYGALNAFEIKTAFEIVPLSGSVHVEPLRSPNTSSRGFLPAGPTVAG